MVASSALCQSHLDECCRPSLPANPIWDFKLELASTPEEMRLRLPCSAVCSDEEIGDTVGESESGETEQRGSFG